MQPTTPEARSAQLIACSSPAPRHERSFPLTTILDRAIVILMVAILLTLSWPVSVVLWHQSHPAPPTIYQQTGSAP